MIEELQLELARRRVVHITDLQRVHAAVLVPIFLSQGQYHILFIQRTDKVRDHKGQISFPGGAFEKEDVAMQNTALREAEEEIGLERDKVRILGELDDMATSGSNYIISPFVGLIPYPYPFKTDQFEIEEIIEVPLSALLEQSCLREGSAQVGGQTVVTYFFHYGNRVIWGATARILNQFLGVISELVEKGATLETR